MIGRSVYEPPPFIMRAMVLTMKRTRVRGRWQALRGKKLMAVTFY